ncbi:MAG: hypothetical protein Q9226_001919 [Calogaya cf. arnoldii]
MAITSTKPSFTRLQDLQGDVQCWHKIRVFLFDLRHFAERPQSRDRLELIIDPSYIAAPYFTPSEVEAIKSFVPNGGETTLEQLILSTLATKLERRKKKRVATGDHRVCPAHDLAPIFEKAFGIKAKDLVKDKKFVKAVTANGLVMK